MIYLLTIQGKDQVGLVEALAEVVESSGGNWLESRLCRLGGQFAGIIRTEFTVEPKGLPERVKSLSCHWQAVSAEEALEAPCGGRKAKVAILAADRPGIVKQISRLLVAAGANVEEVESRVRSAPFSGEQMFEASYLISLPEGSDRAQLSDRLEGLAEELMCDIDFADQTEAATA